MLYTQRCIGILCKWPVSHSHLLKVKQPTKYKGKLLMYKFSEVNPYKLIISLASIC